MDAAQLAALEAAARRELRVARGRGYPRDGNFSGRDSAFSSFQDSLFETTEPLHFRILYVEDERVQAYFFVKKCRRVFGPRCEVVHETDGVAALERLERGEQFAVVVSDIFMSGMDGVSFFRALFSTTLNSGRLKDPNAPAAYSSGGGFLPSRRRSPRTSAGAPGEVDKNDGAEDSSDADLRMNLILTGAEISPDFRDDRELADDLESLAETHGVLTYNKISGVDVVADVIAPHVAYVEQKLALRRAAEMWRASRAGEGDADAAAFGGTANPSLPGRSMDGAGGTGGTMKVAAAAPEEEEDDEYRALRASVMEKLETFASGASGAASAHRRGGGQGHPEVHRSGSSLGAAKPFPDTSAIRALYGSRMDDIDEDATTTRDE